MSDLYETDFLAWTELQAGFLRRVAAGERINDPELDWSNIIEEIESLGRNDIRMMRSLLVQAIAHELKAEAWPLSRDAPSWRAEAIGFRQEARDCYSPSMRGRPELDVTAIYRRALRKMPATIDGQPPLPVTTECPFTSIEELLAEP